MGVRMKPINKKWMIGFILFSIGLISLGIIISDKRLFIVSIFLIIGLLCMLDADNEGFLGKRGK